MIDPRVKKAAEILVNHSTKVKKGEYVVISSAPLAKPLALEVFKLVLKRGAYPKLDVMLPDSSYIYYKYASEKQLKKFPEIALIEAKKADVFIRLYAEENTKELSNIDSKKISQRLKTVKPIGDIMKKKRWVIFEYPTQALAQDADMSLEEFEDFVFKSTNIDWNKIATKLKRIKKLMESGDLVTIKSPDTELSFRTKGRIYVIGDGSYNMPDGEIFTAPIETSTEGEISFTFPSIRYGSEVTKVRLKFKKGSIIKATAEKNEKLLNKIINTDKGSKRLGELGIGLNPGIKRSVKQILFDEKIDGSIHLAIGSAYEECKGTNKSAIHWDFIKDMRKDGKIYLDNKLIYKNGKFIR